MRPARSRMRLALKSHASTFKSPATTFKLPASSFKSHASYYKSRMISFNLPLTGGDLAMHEEHVDEIVELSAPLGKLRERLAQLDAERAEVQQEIDRRVAALATLTTKHFLPVASDAKTSEKLLAIFKSDPQRRLRTS